MADINNIKVRMYRHGFGDCFLLQFFAGKDRVTTMVIDFGLKKNDSVAGITMADVATDIKKVLKGADTSNAKPKLDVLVCTHEHWDHVSGFRQQDKHFDDINIEKIWMAWTEDPDDDEAKVINSSLQKRVKALALASERMKKSNSTTPSFYSNFQYGEALADQRKDFQNALDDVIGFYGPLSVTKTSKAGIKYKDTYEVSIETQKAIDHLRSLAKKGTGIKYFEPGTLFEDKTKFPGVRIYSMGPPKTAMLNKENPSSGAKKEVYLGISDSSTLGFVNGLLAMHDAEQEYEDDGRPFGEVNSLDKATAEKDEYLKSYFSKAQSWRTIEEDWLDIAGALALQMDGDTNNTSLVLAFELTSTNKVLLFPGDAQVGNWLSWHDHEWEVKNGNQTEKVNATRILNNTVFYKVGHHASHNATLKAKGLELMIHDDLVAFVPEKQDQYNGIPFAPLLTQLRKKTKGRTIVSADVNHVAEDVLKKKPDGLSAAEWKEFKDNIEITKLFVEYTVKA